MKRRIGYAEREGLAVLKKERAKARKQEVIGISVAGSNGYNRCVWDKPNKWGGCDYYMNREMVEATWKEGEQNEGTEV